MSYTQFLNYEELRSLASRPAPDEKELQAILDKASGLKGLKAEEAAALLP